MLCRGQNDSWSINGTMAHSKKHYVLASTHSRQLNNKLNEMSSQINRTGIGDEPFKDEYANWRRQRKYYKSETKRLNGEVRQMQGLQQKQLQGDMARGRITMNKSKFNKFDHVNMEVVLGFFKNKMFPIHKFL
jgi:hypothetical protein